MLLFGAFLGGWYVDTNRNADLISRGVSLAGQPLSRATTDQASVAVQDLANRFNNIPVEVQGPDDLRMQTTANQLGMTLDSQATFDAVLNAGTGRSRPDPISWVRSFFSTTEVRAAVEIDTGASAAIVDEIAGLVLTEPGEPSMSLENGRLVAVSGTPGRELDRNALLTTLEADLPEVNTESIRLIAPLRDVSPAISDAELTAFTDQLNGATLSPLSIRAGDIRRSFETNEMRTWLRMSTEDNTLAAGIDAEQVQAAVLERFGDVETLPDFSFLQIVDNKPTLGEGAPEICCGPVGALILEAILQGNSEVTVPLVAGGDEALEAIGIVDLLGEFTTPHEPNQDRVINIQTMADEVRGVVLEPGEEFSINDFIGRRTTEKGYVAAGVINYGVLDTDVGGGVSQFATTMFNAAYFSGLDILDYQMHSIHFSRYPFAREATLSFPQIDLKVRNPGDTHVLLWTDYTDESITVQVYGLAFAEVTDLGTNEGRSGQCRTGTTTRERVFLDGTTETDSFRAVYQPSEGRDCNGVSTLPAVTCGAGEVGVDTDGDGKRDRCEPAFVGCGLGESGFDSNGDGVIDFCQAVAVVCGGGFTPVDTTGNGVPDSCQQQAQGVQCAAGQTAADTNGDGIPDTCQVVVVGCQPGFTGQDTDGDGVIDLCFPDA